MTIVSMISWWCADVNSPVCCPSRSEYLSGRYHHNIRDDHYEAEPNGDVCGGDEAVGSPHPCGCMHVNSTTAEFEGQTYVARLMFFLTTDPFGIAILYRFASRSNFRSRYANYMKQAGYTTGYFGKYLNPPVRPFVDSVTTTVCCCR